MKKNLFILLWALAPVALLAYHYGPGQNELAREDAKAVSYTHLTLPTKA